jgi:predicted unusual protein kinase regulating ubiquinone biosynthesis (AarF/ABC1/UbiB family)
MFKYDINAIRRFFTVIRLFINIALAFYTLKFKKYLHRPGWLQQKREELYISQARLFRETAVNMGGLLIKLGQFISTRVDILPGSSIRELSGLQDEVQAVEFEAIENIILSELEKPWQEIFVHLEATPVAAASLGQVHFGILMDGREVAVKVMRPGHHYSFFRIPFAGLLTTG